MTTKKKGWLFRIPRLLSSLLFIGLFGFVLPSLPSVWIEEVYSRRIFPVLASLQGLLFNSFETSLTLLAYLAILALLPVTFFSVFFLNAKRASFLTSLLRACTQTVFVSALTFSFFSLFWGLNYQRQSLETLFDLPAVSPMENQKALESLALVTNELRKEIPGNCEDHKADFSQTEIQVRQYLEDFLRENGFPLVANSRVKQHMSGSLWLSFGTAGMFCPFTGETNVTMPTAAFSLPFLIGHELAHLHGFAHEQDASFLSVLALSRSKTPEIRYSALLAFFGYVPRSKRKELLSENVLNDFACRKAFWQKNIGPWSQVSDNLYDKYLKSQGVKIGKKSYSRVVQLVLKADKKDLLHFAHHDDKNHN